MILSFTGTKYLCLFADRVHLKITPKKQIITIFFHIFYNLSQRKIYNWSSSRRLFVVCCFIYSLFLSVKHRLQYWQHLCRLNKTQFQFHMYSMLMSFPCSRVCAFNSPTIHVWCWIADIWNLPTLNTADQFGTYSHFQ